MLAAVVVGKTEAHKAQEVLVAVVQEVPPELLIQVAAVAGELA